MVNPLIIIAITAVTAISAGIGLTVKSVKGLLVEVEDWFDVEL